MEAVKLIEDVTSTFEHLDANPKVVIGNMDLIGHLEVDSVGAVRSDADERHGYINEVVIYAELPESTRSAYDVMHNNIAKVISTINILENAASSERCREARELLIEFELVASQLALVSGITSVEQYMENVPDTVSEPEKTHGMKISEVISALEAIKDAQGDIDCMCPPCSGDNFRPVERVGTGIYDDGTVKADIMDGEGELDD